jgi:hypothetical protein
VPANQPDATPLDLDLLDLLDEATEAVSAPPCPIVLVAIASTALAWSLIQDKPALKPTALPAKPGESLDQILGRACVKATFEGRRPLKGRNAQPGVPHVLEAVGQAPDVPAAPTVQLRLEMLLAKSGPVFEGLEAPADEVWETETREALHAYTGPARVALLDTIPDTTRRRTLTPGSPDLDTTRAWLELLLRSQSQSRHPGVALSRYGQLRITEAGPRIDLAPEARTHLHTSGLLDQVRQAADHTFTAYTGLEAENA